MPFLIRDFAIAPLTDNKFIRPVRLTYTQDGKPYSWEAVKSHDSVAVLLYHREKQAFLTVKQFRPAVHLHHPAHTFTYELCAGLVDKKLSLEDIAREEIDEECGYAVTIEQLSKITSFFTHVGITGCKQYLYFAVVDESMRIHGGGGIANEQILLEFIPLKQARGFLCDETLAKTPGLMFAFTWFLERYGERAEKLFIDEPSDPPA
jgi:UDP-sugar diphosphatase